MFKVNNKKHQNNSIVAILVLTLNIFYTFLQCFYC